jgi:hypothetical protein
VNNNLIIKNPLRTVIPQRVSYFVKVSQGPGHQDFLDTDVVALKKVLFKAAMLLSPQAKNPHP